MSSSTGTSTQDTPSKKRRLSVLSTRHDQLHQEDTSHDPPTPVQNQTHIPKRGARACTACRKGKNRCEGEAPCRRCQLSGTPCIFEKPEKKSPPIAGPSVERLSRLEGQHLVMQSQMIGMQSSLDRILSAVQTQAHVHVTHPNGHDSPYVVQRNGLDPTAPSDRPRFPPLPGFQPPPHKYAAYGIPSSTAPSTDDESEETLSRANINAPIEALQGLANAAAEAAAAAPAALSPKMKKRKRVEPTPRNAFPHVVEKGLVPESEARELFHIFFAGCHLFIPLFDPSYDTYESLSARSPWTFDAVLAIASKIRSAGGSPTLSPTTYKCLDEAQGIARSTLFGPIVKKEGVQGMLLLAAWSTNGWIPSGHALRMALDLGLHRALEKLADDQGSGKRRSEEEERDLVVSARIWLCLYWHDHQMSLGTGRPIVLRDESSIKNCRVLLNHPMASPTDVRLISLIELIVQKTHIYEGLTPLNGEVNHNTLAFIRRANIALDKWYADCDELHRQTMDEDALQRKILAGELYYAKLWLVCVALRGTSWDRMRFEQRELAFQAKDAAVSCLAVFLNSTAYRAALRYAVHDTLVTAAFSALFLLKMANMFPTELDLTAIMAQVEQLALLFSNVGAERYALTLRVMLANLRRKIGINTNATATVTVQGTGPGTGTTTPTASIPPPPPPQVQDISHPAFNNDSGWVDDRLHGQGKVIGQAPAQGQWQYGVAPNVIPVWLQEKSLHDLGLPVNGHDGIFLPMQGWGGDVTPMPEAW